MLPIPIGKALTKAFLLMTMGLPHLRPEEFALPRALPICGQSMRRRTWNAAIIDELAGRVAGRHRGAIAESLRHQGSGWIASRRGVSAKPSVAIVGQCSFSFGLVARRISQQHSDHVANRQWQANATKVPITKIPAHWRKRRAIRTGYLAS